MTKPKIFVFSGHPKGGEGPCCALAEDGHVLGQHFCSNEDWAKSDLGVREGSRPDRHEHYAEHYPDGYEMEFVRARDKRDHAGVQLALQRNRELAAQEED